MNSVVRGKVAMPKTAFKGTGSGASDAGRVSFEKGMRLLRQENYKLAKIEFNKAIKINPGGQIYWLRLAQAQHALLQIDEAIISLKRAFGINKADADVCQLLADLLLAQHRNEEACAVLDDLDSKTRKSAQWYLAKGKAYLALLDIDSSIKSCASALAAALPEDKAIRTQSILGMGHGFMIEAMYVEAATCYRMLLDENPTDLGAAIAAAYASSWACDWKSMLEDFDRLKICLFRTYEKGESIVSGNLSPFSLITLADDPGLMQWVGVKAYAFSKKKVFCLPFKHESKIYRSNGRIRVGMLSCDFHEHATSMLVAEFFENFNSDCVELYIYSGGPLCEESPLRQRLKKSAAKWCETANLSSQGLADIIRSDKIGVLVEMKGYTQGGRMDVLAYRPAPLQVSWLGYPGTTGCADLDYFIGDPVVTPLDQQEFYTEKLAQLPYCYQPNDSHRSLSETHGTRKDHDLPENADFVFASFNMAYKIIPEMFDAWCRILNAVPGAVLWLLIKNDDARLRLKERAVQNGLDPTRIVFAQFVKADQHRARLPLADMCLDTYPCGGHTTASDALWAGVPLLAMTGQIFASRVAASLLNTLGLNELVCADIDQYVDNAVYWATHPDQYRQLRQRLHDARKTSPLFDGVRFARDFEKLIVRMVDRYDAGLPAAPLAAER